MKYEEDLYIKRGVRDICSKCNGQGAYYYPNGSTWRSGIGTAAFRWDVCDVCWGSGDDIGLKTVVTVSISPVEFVPSLSKAATYLTSKGIT